MSSSRQIVVVAVAGVLLLVSGARAAQYPAWGDTGWVYANKRECCDAAVQIAQQYSAEACYTAGGQLSPTSLTRRGVCRWESGADPWGQPMMRCTAEAALWCR